ncbi:MAG: hypothetical protein Q9172_004677 [Xanthocarpia lactea]
MSRLEQALRLRGTIPTVEEFWSYRLGSSAVHITLAMNEFAFNNKSLPTSVIEQEDMTLLWEYTNIIISITNDILSLKKEIVGTTRLPAVPRQPVNGSGPQARGSIGSIIPLEYVQSRNARAAVDKTALLLAKAIDAFQHTAQQLLQRSAEKLNGEQARAVGDIVKGCQFYSTGNLAWRYGIVIVENFDYSALIIAKFSLATRRYGIYEHDLSKRVCVTL